MFEVKWAAAREEARKNRRSYTDVLKAHGVEGQGYLICTETIYIVIFGGRAYEIRQRRRLPSKANLRDHMDNVELGAVMLTEALAARRIEQVLALGNQACAEVTEAVARQVARIVQDIGPDDQIAA